MAVVAQACMAPGVVDAQALPVSSTMGSASISARKPIVRLPGRLPLMIPTTPVRPIPVTISSTPKDFTSPQQRPRCCRHHTKSRDFMQVMPPFADFLLEFGGSVQNRHSFHSWVHRYGVS